MKLDTIITSPRRIAGGQGAWTGSLAEAIERHYWDFVTVIERDTETDFGDDMPAAEALAEHITAEMIEEVLGDPNAEAQA